MMATFLLTTRYVNGQTSVREYADRAEADRVALDALTLVAVESCEVAPDTKEPAMTNHSTRLAGRGFSEGGHPVRQPVCSCGWADDQTTDTPAALEALDDHLTAQLIAPARQSTHFLVHDAGDVMASFPKTSPDAEDRARASAALLGGQLGAGYFTGYGFALTKVTV